MEINIALHNLANLSISRRRPGFEIDFWHGPRFGQVRFGLTVFTADKAHVIASYELVSNEKAVEDAWAELLVLSEEHRASEAAND